MADRQTGRADAERPDGKGRRSAPRAAATKRPRVARITEIAARQFRELIGKELEGVTGLERTDDGWTVQIDVLELRRVPGTTDVLGTYEVTVDAHGDLEGYQQTSRYLRGDTRRAET